MTLGKGLEGAFGENEKGLADRRDGRLVSPLGQEAEELGDLGGGIDPVKGLGGFAGRADENCDTAGFLDGLESRLVGGVVAHEDGQGAGGLGLKDAVDRLALVPVDVGSDLKDHLAAGNLDFFPLDGWGDYLVENLLNLGDDGGLGEAVMNAEAQPFVFNEDSGVLGKL